MTTNWATFGNQKNVKKPQAFQNDYWKSIAYKSLQKKTYRQTEDKVNEIFFFLEMNNFYILLSFNRHDL